MGLNMNSTFVVFLLTVGFQYFTFKLSLFKYFTLQSNFKDYWRYDADVKKPTSLYLIQIYALNLFSKYDQIVLRK